MKTGAVLAAMAISAIAGWAQSSRGISPPVVDKALEVTDGSVPLFKGYAKGVQIYSCKPSAADPAKFVFDADHAEPDATLTNESGDIVIHHYLSLDPAGPTWEAKDGSKVIAKKVDPPQKRPGTIAWLRLQVVAHEGSGMMSPIKFVQRVDTQGGTAPAGDCDPVRAARVRVPYKATYYFYGPAY